MNRSFSIYIYSLLLSSFILSNNLFYSQRTPVTIESADVLEYIVNDSVKVRKLSGNVRLRQNEVVVNCDNALYYAEANQVEAFGHVHIRQADSINIYGDTLHYDGNSKLASLSGRVVMTEGNMRLSTGLLYYDMRERIARYPNGAELKNKESTLTSKTGYYYSRTKNAFFKRDVKLVNKEYTLEADTLLYNTDSRITYFLGPTIIRTKESVIWCTRGWYDTEHDRAVFTNRAVISNPPRELTADSIYYDRNLGLGRAYGNIILSDTAQNLTILSRRAIYYEKTNTMEATDRPVMINVIDRDSLYIAADTLRSIEDSTTGQRTLYAYHNVRIFKQDLQGACDSLVYKDQDSAIHLYNSPYLWTDSTQLSADTIHIQLINKKIGELRLHSNSFVAMRNDSLLYNQIKGRQITGFFRDDTLRTVEVNGNGESIYYAMDTKKGYIGINKTICSRMILEMEDNKVSRIISTGQPEATFFPIQQIRVEDFILEGFEWKGNLKPGSKEELFL